MTNCWLERSPLETAFLLILVVAVPYLIGITSFYIYCLTLKSDCPASGCIHDSDSRHSDFHDCSNYCKDRSRSDIISIRHTQLNPNISRLRDKHKICSDSTIKDFEDKIDHKFVASVLEDIYVDDSSEQRYLCAAAIITFKWVVTSDRCIQKANQHYQTVTGLYVRAGSNFWSKGGSIHEVNKILFAEEYLLFPTVAAIELKIEFPKLPTIRPIMLCQKSHYTNYGIAEMLSWKGDDSLPLALRNKHTNLVSEPAVIFKDARCEHETNQQPNIFCAISVKPPMEECANYSGIPLIRARILLGMDVGQYCDLKKNITMYLIYDLTNALQWLIQTTGVYVENF